jgi:lipopolysaccharide transport system ATP-binding protein
MGPILQVQDLGKCFHLRKARDPFELILGKTLSRFFKRSTRTNASKDLWALRNVSFSLRPGEIVGVIGENGAGKTTLLKILARVTVPTEGWVRGRGRVISLLEMGTAFQPDLSGRENVYFNAALFGIPRSVVDRRFDDIVDFAELGEFIDLPVRHYSSGMYLRLAFSLAINVNPDILLADEVLAVGDARFQQRCLERVSEAGRQGTSVLFVSHDMEAIRRLCPTSLRLRQGRLVEMGTTSEVVSRYQQSALSDGHENAIKSGAFRSEWGELLSVQLESAQHQPIGSVKMTEDFFVSIAFRVFKSGIVARCAMDVFCGGLNAFRAVDPTGLPADGPGLFKVRARVPGNLLSDKSYSMNVAVNFEGNGENKPAVSYNAVSFRVYNVDEIHSARGTFLGPMAGVLSPRLDWERGEFVSSRAGVHP